MDFARGRREAQHKWSAIAQEWDEASRAEIVQRLDEPVGLVILLSLQIVIVAAQVTIDWRLWRGGSMARPRLGRTLRVVSYLYALAMLGRWVLTRTHAIPIALHWMLAAYLFTLDRVYAGPIAERRLRAAGR